MSEPCLNTGSEKALAQFGYTPYKWWLRVANKHLFGRCLLLRFHQNFDGKPKEPTMESAQWTTDGHEYFCTATQGSPWIIFILFVGCARMNFKLTSSGLFCTVREAKKLHIFLFCQSKPTMSSIIARLPTWLHHYDNTTGLWSKTHSCHLWLSNLSKPWWRLHSQKISIISLCVMLNSRRRFHQKSLFCCTSNFFDSHGTLALNSLHVICNPHLGHLVPSFSVIYILE